MNRVGDAPFLAMLIIAAVALTSAWAAAGCIRLPEYVVRVEADPDVTWWGFLRVTRNIGAGRQSRGTRIPQDTLESDLDSWEITLEHETHNPRVGVGTRVHGRITAVSVRIYKTGAEGSVRVEIVRVGEVVAQAETARTGASAHCEHIEGH
ncbi:MAG TPA: hypothetical protein DGR79_03355 [Clostridiales bacterium]|nr:hypothetical protein [Clostridiales bacterium]